MGRLRKAIKKYGLLLCIVKVFRKGFFKIYSKFNNLENKMSAKRNKQYDELEKLIKKSNYKEVFIFYPYTEWDIPVFQRPQQIALSLTKNKDILYLFCTKNVSNDHIDGLYKQVKDNLLIVTDFEFLFNLKISLLSTKFLFTEDEKFLFPLLCFLNLDSLCILIFPLLFS